MSTTTKQENKHKEEISLLREKISILENQLLKLNDAENNIEESEQRFRILFNTMSLGIVYQDDKGIIVSWNEQKTTNLVLVEYLSFNPTFKSFIYNNKSDFACSG